MARQVAAAPVPVDRVAPELPAALAAIITRALAKDPNARWQSAADMAEALRRASAADQLLSPVTCGRGPVGAGIEGRQCSSRDCWQEWRW